MKPRRLSVAQTPASAPEYLRRLWDEAKTIKDGAELEIPFDSENDAVRAQRWTWRERKRAKAQLIDQAIRGGQMIDPDSADLWRGLVTEIRGTVLVVRRPKPPREFILRQADGTTKKIKI